MPTPKKTAKPTVFFSHSSRDAAPLAKLKDAFLAKTGNSIDVFLSSDGQSIPLGANWVHRVEKGLDDAQLMFVFVSPASLKSHWLFFEAGYAYSRQLRVVPIGIHGADLTKIPPPLSLLQGRNLVSADGLNNLIAEVNRVFDRKHPEDFTAAHYEAIFSGPGSSDHLGGPLSLVSRIEFQSLPSIEHLPGPEFKKAYQAVQTVLSGRETGYAADTIGGQHAFETHGVRIELFEHDRLLSITIDPLAVDAGIELCVALANVLEGAKATNCQLKFRFAKRVKYLSGSHQISARMDPSRFSIIGASTFRFGSLSFELKPASAYIDVGTQLVFSFGDESINRDRILEVLRYLVENGIVYLSDEQKEPGLVAELMRRAENR